MKKTLISKYTNKFYSSKHIVLKASMPLELHIYTGTQIFSFQISI